MNTEKKRVRRYKIKVGKVNESSIFSPDKMMSLDMNLISPKHAV